MRDQNISLQMLRGVYDAIFFSSDSCCVYYDSHVAGSSHIDDKCIRFKSRGYPFPCVQMA